MRCDVLWWRQFLSLWCLRFYLGQREAVKGKYTINYILYLLTLGVFPCSMIGSASMTIFAPTTTTISRFTLKDKCRSEKWEVYLYGDMTITVMGSRRAENCGFLRSCSSWRDGKAFFGPCTQVHGLVDPRHQGGTPAIRAGKGWRGRRSLLPGVLPPNWVHLLWHMEKHMS